MRVELTTSELFVADHVAYVRQCANEAARKPESVTTCNTAMVPIRRHRFGARAEIAFCKWHNVFPDLTSQPRFGGHDCIINGRRWDVKATEDPRIPLMNPVHKRPDEVEFYALGVVEPHGLWVDFVGWASSAELNCEATKELASEGRWKTDSYVLWHNQLHPFPDDLKS